MSWEKLQVISHYLDENCKMLEINKKKLLQNKKDKKNNNENYYWPNTDSTIWMRSCENEVIEPLSGNVTGVIPEWIRGSLLRNGPGNLKVGPYTFQHLFDSSALLHRYFFYLIFFTT